MLVGIHVGESWLHKAASVLRCKFGIVPFVYFGLSVGGEPRHLSFWEPLITRIKSHLLEWKSRHLSLGGRLVLLKLS